MIVHELDLFRAVVAPDETDAELVVDADRPPILVGRLSRAVVGQSVQPVARRHAKVFDGGRGIEPFQPPPRRLDQIGRKALGRAAFEDRARIAGFPALDHTRV